MPRNWAQEFTEFRRKHGFSQPDLAKALGICERTVWSVEHGRPARFQTRLRFHEFVKLHDEPIEDTAADPATSGPNSD